jgi:hypothetical protein
MLLDVMYGEMPTAVYHKDGNLRNFRLDNLTTEPPKKYKKLSLLELADLVKYDPETGEITLKNGIPITRSVNKRWGHLRISIQGNWVYVHRLAWACYYHEIPNIIDHIDGNPTNNRIVNIRNGDQRQNTQNKKIHRDGRLIGAIKTGNGRWQAVVYVSGVKHHLGYYSTELEAHTVYCDFCRERGLTVSV